MLEQYPLGTNVRELTAEKRKMAGLEPVSQPVSQQSPNPAYQALLPRLLVPALWETQGAVMSLTRLMQAYLLHNVEAVLATNKVCLRLHVCITVRDWIAFNSIYHILL